MIVSRHCPTNIHKSFDLLNLTSHLLAIFNLEELSWLRYLEWLWRSMKALDWSLGETEAANSDSSLGFLKVQCLQVFLGLIVAYVGSLFDFLEFRFAA